MALANFSLRRFLKGTGAQRLRMKADASAAAEWFTPAAFHAQKNTAVTATTEIAAYLTPVTNVGNCFNATTGRFTAPVAGTYVFNWSFLNQNAVSELSVNIGKNGAAIGSGIGGEAYYAGVANNLYPAAQCAVLSLAAGDYVSLFVIVGTTFTNVVYNNFSGFQIG